MKRTNIHLRDDQRDGMVKVAEKRRTKPAKEYREAVDNHLQTHLAARKPNR